MKQKIQLEEARQIATVLVDKLRVHCQRIEIAGSIRREKPEVGDIEIVAIPCFIADLFGVPSQSALDTLDWNDFGGVVKAGSKYKQIKLHQGVNLDLFIVTPPAQWGVQFILRTGPKEYSHKIVTPRKHGGLLPSYLRVQQGAIWSHNHIVPTAEEIDVSNLMGLPYVEPRLR